MLKNTCHSHSARLNSQNVFPGSSVVEQLTVNQLVAGSNPARGAISFKAFSQIHQNP